MNLGHQIGTRSKGKYRVYVQKKDDNQPLAVSRLHKELKSAKKDMKAQAKKHGAIYAEVRNGHMVEVVWLTEAHRKAYVSKHTSDDVLTY